MRDGQLLRQYTESGSREAFDQIVERYLDAVFSYCRRETGDTSSAEDLTQNVFLLLASKPPRLRDDGVLSGWFFVTARNLARNARRQEVRRQQYERQAALEMGPQHDSDCGENRLWDAIEPHLNDALSALRPPDREVILRRFFDRLSLREIAEAGGISEEAARKRVSRSLEKMRKYLRRRGVVVAGAVLGGLLSGRAAQAAPDRLTLRVHQACAMKTPAVATSPVISVFGVTVPQFGMVILLSASVVFLGVRTAPYLPDFRPKRNVYPRFPIQAATAVAVPQQADPGVLGIYLCHQCRQFYPAERAAELKYIEPATGHRLVNAPNAPEGYTLVPE